MLKKIPIISKNALNKRFLELNFLQIAQWTPSLSPAKIDLVGSKPDLQKLLVTAREISVNDLIWHKMSARCE